MYYSTRLILPILILSLPVFFLNTDIIAVEQFNGGKVILENPSIVIPAPAQGWSASGGKAGIQKIDSPVKPGNDKRVNPDITAQAAVVADGKTGRILYAKNIAAKTSLASLTKLMSFFLLSEKDLDLDEVVQLNEDDLENLRVYINPEDNVSSLKLAAGSQIKIRDLFYAGLIKSANDVLIPAVRAAGGNFFSFAREMNERALQFGMNYTRFDEPTGLSVKNVGTAGDLVLLALNVFENEFIKDITSRDSYGFNFTTSDVHGTSDVGVIQFDSTNKLFEFLEGTPYKIIAGKTGYLDESGYNLIVKIQNDEGEEFVIVVLGSDSDESRFTDAYKLLKWADGQR